MSPACSGSSAPMLAVSDSDQFPRPMQERDWQELPNNWATGFAEKMNTVEKLHLMLCGLGPSPSVSSWTPLGPTRNSSGSKKSQAHSSSPHSHADTWAGRTLRESGANTALRFFFRDIKITILSPNYPAAWLPV